MFEFLKKNEFRTPIKWPEMVTPDIRTDGGLATDVNRLRGLFEGTDGSINLYSPMSYSPINVVKALTGTPEIKSDDPSTQQLLNKLHKSYITDEAPIITSETLMYGTSWRFVQYVENRGAFIENIQDNEIIGIKVDPITNAITDVWLDKIRKYKSGGNIPIIKQNRIRRHITRDAIEIEIDGKKNIINNFFHLFPLPFAHDGTGDSYRGVSVYSRIYRSAKVAHDVMRNAAEIAAEYQPKLVQTIADTGVDAALNWLSAYNQARGAPKNDLINPARAKIFFNSPEDSTQLLSLPSDAIGMHEKLLARLDEHIIRGSGIPQIFWGDIGHSNYAAADIASELGVKYIMQVQREQTKWWQCLVQDWLRVESYTSMIRVVPESIEIVWPSFDLLGTEGRSRVLTAYAGAITTLVNSGIMTKNMLYYFLKEFFKDAPENNSDDYLENIMDWAGRIAPVISSANAGDSIL
ncbi:MAG: hypothetical protein LBJ41_01825 [Treponema sp.]|jgi:hypothetical protein|nr:hypothetical protein [Treponema sp.]